eukprot:446943-Prorocentrum_minimum.AAC.1
MRATWRAAVVSSTARTPRDLRKPASFSKVCAGGGGLLPVRPKGARLLSCVEHLRSEQPSFET